MKKVILILAILTFEVPLAQNATSSENNIIGEWKSEDDSSFGYFIFEDDGSAIIETEDDILGGVNFEQNGMKFSLEYKIFYETKPIEIDLTFTELKSGQQLIWPGIVRFKNEHEILLAIGSDGKRPDNFITADYAIFKRSE